MGDRFEVHIVTSFAILVLGSFFCDRDHIDLGIFLAVLGQGDHHIVVRKCIRAEHRIAITLHAGTNGDQLTNDNVLLQTDQRIYLTLDGCFRQNLRGLLEGCR